MFHECVLLTIAAIVTRISALAVREPTAYIYSYAPAPTPTPAPHIQLRRQNGIVARDLTASGRTCGFIDRNANDAITCGEGYKCLYWPPIPAYSESYGITGRVGAVDCYTTDTDLYSSSAPFSIFWPATRCVNYNSRYNTADYPVTTSQVMYCGVEGRTCATYVFRDAPANYFTSLGASSSVAAALAELRYTALYCTDTSTVEYVYATPTNVPSSSLAVSSSSYATIDSSSKSKTTPTSASSSSAASTDTGGGGSGGSSSNVGIIAGSTVAGVIAVAAIVGIVVVLVVRKRTARKPPMSEVSNNYY